MAVAGAAMSSVAAAAWETPGAMVTSRATTRAVTASAHRHTGARRPLVLVAVIWSPPSAAPIASDIALRERFIIRMLAQPAQPEMLAGGLQLFGALVLTTLPFSVTVPDAL